MKILAALLGTALACASCNAPSAAIQRPRAVQSQTFLKVMPLHYASAPQVSAALHGMIKNVRIVPDERTNSLVISYESDADLAQVERCIAQLDVEVKSEKH